METSTLATFVTRPVSVTALAGLIHWVCLDLPVQPNISLEIFEKGPCAPFSFGV